MSKRIVDLSGQKFNRLLVLSLSPTRLYGRTSWFCICDCGNIVEVNGCSLKSGNTKSCGCYNSEVAAKRLTKHGMSFNAKSNNSSIENKEYQLWINIKQRCYNKNCPDYSNYGGLGIILYSNWINDFQAFYDYLQTLNETRDQFESRTGLSGIYVTIDRINTNRNYEPGNLRWATKEEQSRNRNYNVISNILEADQIRSEYNNGGITELQLSIKYGCSRSVISQIITNKSWI